MCVTSHSCDCVVQNYSEFCTPDSLSCLSLSFISPLVPIICLRSPGMELMLYFCQHVLPQLMMNPSICHAAIGNKQIFILFLSTLKDTTLYICTEKKLKM